jgi:hypothetical protein
VAVAQKIDIMFGAKIIESFSQEGGLVIRKVSMNELRNGKFNASINKKFIHELYGSVAGRPWSHLNCEVIESSEVT